MQRRSVSLACVVAVVVLFSGFAGLAPGATTAIATTQRMDERAAAKANIWMATNGNDAGANCSRFGSPVSNPDPSGASVCSTLAKSFALSRGGDVIGVLPGDYSSQSVSGAKTSPGVRADMGITGTSASFANLNVGSSTSWFTIANGRTGYNVERSTAGVTPDHITFRNIASTSVVFINGGTNIAIIGGSVGPIALSGEAAMVLEGIPAPLTGVLVQGVRFHDVTRSEACSASGCHAEVIRIDDGASNITLAGNTFEASNDPNTSTVFLGSKTGANQTHDLLLRNNFFADPGAAFYSVNENLSGGCANITLEYNTFASGAAALLNSENCGGRLSGVVVRGNLGAHIAGCRPGIEYSHNLWSDGVCGPSDRTARDLRFAADGFHVTSTSPARGAGDPASAPGNDIDGDPRPQRMPPDAGADQQEPAMMVLGRLIGKVKIGASQNDVRALYGNPSSSATKPLGKGAPRVLVELYRQPGGTIWVGYAGGSVVAVGTTTPYYSTPSGLGVGTPTTNASIRNALGRTTCPTAYRRKLDGVLVTVAARKGSVRSITMIVSRYAGESQCPAG